ncbi:hypothetical protein Bca4012_094269 [Brassica carinata]
MAQTKLNVNAIAKKIQKMYIEESYKPQENNKTESILETEELIKPRRRRRGRGNRGFSGKCYSVYFTSMFLTREQCKTVLMNNRIRNDLRLEREKRGGGLWQVDVVC